jgi:hypothetical protein
VPVRRPKSRPWQPRSFLATWLAIALVIAPFAHASLPTEAVAGPAVIVDSPAAQDGADAGALHLAIPARTATLEATLALAAAKTPELRAAVDALRVGPRPATAVIGDSRPRFQRSAVGTARTPTGPPA